MCGSCAMTVNGRAPRPAVQQAHPRAVMADRSAFPRSPVLRVAAAGAARHILPILSINGSTGGASVHTGLGPGTRRQWPRDWSIFTRV